ncbi:hypothetical protein B0H11DRAFT_2192857 [Mycena galericulata]|nr:hypothetical protein B0H11DRAFT_2192857 [Mycena galericulata]
MRVLSSQEQRKAIQFGGSGIDVGSGSGICFLKDGPGIGIGGGLKKFQRRAPSRGNRGIGGGQNVRGPKAKEGKKCNKTASRFSVPRVALRRGKVKRRDGEFDSQVGPTLDSQVGGLQLSPRKYGGLSGRKDGAAQGNAKLSKVRRESQGTVPNNRASVKGQSHAIRGKTDLRVGGLRLDGILDPDTEKMRHRERRRSPVPQIEGERELER